jgi:hypothetical protein
MQDEMLARGTGKLPTPEIMGPSIICLAQQSAEGITGQILHTDDHGVSWP